jgi:hypothetical protein
MRRKLRRPEERDGLFEFWEGRLEVGSWQLVVVGKVGGWRDEAGFEGGFVGDQSGTRSWLVCPDVTGSKEALTTGQEEGRRRKQCGRN